MEVSPHELVIIIKILNEIIDVSQWIGDVVDEGYLTHHGKGQTFNDRIYSPFIQVVTVPTQHPSEFELDTFRGKRVTIFHDLFHVNVLADMSIAIPFLYNIRWWILDVFVPNPIIHLWDPTVF